MEIARCVDMARVYPSGLALNKSEIAIEPLPPGLFTITRLAFGKYFGRYFAKILAPISVEPPAANGTSTSIGFVG